MASIVWMKKLNDYIINFYDEGVFSYDTFTGIWHEYASFIEIVKLILSGLLVY